jgi:hypothetical protein
MSLFESASLVVTPNGAKASKLYAIKPTSGAGDLSVTRATTATRVNSAGLIESVASNVPRLDYTNGSCPSILVEPQRTNLALRSDDFGNGYWGKFNTTITANNTTAPDGTTTADKFVETAANNFHSMDSTFTSGTGIYSTSVYAKVGERRYLRLNITEITPAVDHTALFDLQTGTLLSSGTGVTAKIISVGNGWYRISVTSPALVGGQVRMALLMQTTTSSTPQSYTGDGTSGIYLWGAQLEAGSYATSYIPTTSASVTRNADVISKTGISSLIGQTSGTVFIDIDIDSSFAQADTRFINVTDGTSANWYFIGTNNPNEFRFYFRSSSTVYVTNVTTFTSGRHKLAFAYKNNDYVAYIDGVQVNNTTTLVVGSTSKIELGNSFGSDIGKEYINTSALWKTRLTNTQLAQLTTI